jgi:beta-glucosidase
MEMTQGVLSLPIGKRLLSFPKPGSAPSPLLESRNFRGSSPTASPEINSGDKMNFRIANLSSCYMHFVLACAIAVLIAVGSVVQAQPKPSSAEIEIRVDALLSKLTLDEKITLIGGINDFYTRPIPRVNIPSLRMSDGPTGVHDYGPTTEYPAGILLAASWDADLARRVGVSMGQDARARGVHFILAPGLNIYRSPLNGRNFEYFGEDPYLASRMAVNIIEGIQSQNVIATAKHFIANNSEYGRMDHSSDIDERTLREIYLPAFEASIREAKVGALMDAYNLVNGVYMTQNCAINVQIAKKEWGFDGIIMSDWGATHDGIAAANNGLDLEMPNAAFMNAATLLPALKNGTVTEATIDDKVRRILRKAIEFGFLDRGQTDPTVALYSQSGRRLTLEEARDGMVLLKNENHLLPLDRKKIKTLAVLGPDAYPAVTGGGGSSLTKPFNEVSCLQGISDVAGNDVRVLYTTETAPLDAVVSHTEVLTSPGGAPGLKGEFFDNENLSGEPALVRTDKLVDFHWGEGSYRDGGPADHFSARWAGYFVPQSEDDYRFYISADDGARLYINDDLVIDDWRRHGETLDTYTKHLKFGITYKLRLEYFENVGSATIRFGIAPLTVPFGDESKRLASKADAVILCMGFDSILEGEATDRTFRLPGGQDAFIQQVLSVNKNVVVVLHSGGGVDMTTWIDQVPAILQAWYPGQEAGTALGQLLFGDFGPSGKLPVSFERRAEDNPTFHSYYPQKDKNVGYTEGVFVGYRGYEKAATKPLFPFGYGLSYTSFAYSDLRITPAAKESGALIAVSFKVKNNGSREGAEIAQVYVGDSHSPLPRPAKELKGFAKVSLRPGEATQLTVLLDRRAFSYYDVSKHGWSAAPGEFGILVGASSVDIKLQGKYSLVPGEESR